MGSPILTLQGHPRSYVAVLLDSPYLISCWCLIVTRDLTRLLYDIQAFEMGVTLTVTSQVHESQMQLHQWTPHKWTPHTFLLMRYSNIWPNSAPLREFVWVNYFRKGITCIDHLILEAIIRVISDRREPMPRRRSPACI